MNGQEPLSIVAQCAFYLRMRGLPWGTSKENIKTFFDQIIVDLEHVNILKMPDGKDSGEALVGLYSKQDLDTAMTYEKKFLQNRYIELYPASSEEWERVAQRTNRQLPIPIKQDSFVLLMRGLPYSVHEDDCVAFFEGVECLGVHLTKDASGRPSGQGYAEFETLEQFQNAMLLNRKHMHSRYVELFESSVKDLVEACTGQVKTQRGGRRISNNNQNYGAPPQHNRSHQQQQQHQPHHHHNMDGSGGGDGHNIYDNHYYAKPSCVRMRGLPYNSTENDITKFFVDGGVTPSRIHRKADGTEAFAEFRTPQEQEKAMEKNKAFMGPRYIELFSCDFDEMAKKVGLTAVAPTHNQPQSFGGHRGFHPYGKQRG